MIQMTRWVRTALILLTVLLLCPPAAAQDEEETPIEEQDVAKLVRQLRDLSVVRLDMNTKGIVARQKRKIELANQILEHEDSSDSDYNFATIVRLQAYGVQFAIKYKDKQLDKELNEEYADAIDEALDLSDKNIAFEATTAAASFRAGVYNMDSTEENADQAASAISRLNDIAPKDPLVQATRRLLLEQMKNSDSPRLVFEKLKDSDDTVASIVLDQLDQNTTPDEANFLWAKHFAKFGDFIAQRRLANMYETGLGTRKNYSQAARWYQKLARLNDMKALVKLGDFYLEGKGYFKNPETAAKNYLTAAKAGSRVAQFKLAECYRTGSGVSQSDDNWQKWIKSAASNASNAEVQQVYTSIDFRNAADSYRVFYESLVEQNPDDVYYLNNLAYSLLISSKNDPERSLQLINEALENIPKDFHGTNSFLDTKATALKQLSKWQEAADIFESILPDVEDKKPVLESLVECYQQLKSEKAAEYQQQLKAIGDKMESDSKADAKSDQIDGAKR